MKYFIRVINSLGWPMWIALAGGGLGLLVAVFVPLSVGAPEGLFLSVPFITLFVWLFWKFMFGPMVRDERLKDIGVDADAKILAIAENGSSIQIGGAMPKPGMDILLEVHPQGGAPYQTKVSQYLSMFEIKKYQPGGMIRVKYDPAKPQEVTFVDGVSTLGSYASTGADSSSQMTSEESALLEKTIAEIKQLKKDQDDLLSHGTQYNAVVLSNQDLGIKSAEGAHLVEMTVEVQSPSGKYRATFKAPILESGLSKYAVGKTVFVRVDPNNINRVILAGSPENHGQQYKIAHE